MHELNTDKQDLVTKEHTKSIPIQIYQLERNIPNLTQKKLRITHQPKKKEKIKHPY